MNNAGHQRRWANQAGVRHKANTHSHAHHHRHGQGGLTRRQFVSRSAGLGLAAAAASGLAGTAVAGAKPPGGSQLPKQLPSSSPILEGLFGMPIPFLLPFEIDPFINPGPLGDPTTFDDFTGKMAMVEAEGVSANNSEGVPRTWAVDARFWEGRYIDRSGHVRNGAFTFL